MHTVLSKEIVLGGGCFWCVEAVFDEINGILTSEVGYSGGQDNPTYKSVSNGDGNIEVVKLTYNPNQISLEKILTIFFKMHDPTSKDKQGADKGIQYRSIIFYSNDEDLDVINSFIKNIQKQYLKTIVTEIAKLQKYYKAEEYHQKYFKKNPSQAYCQSVIIPKIEKTSIYR
ncbi:peptide-methionine (S)-S-oxide reductase MsrA [Campylobacter insulaenigrae]|uniref:peptide-methionine (S)-S-oxide reductase MsrA n=1 Tax=Campylobacter insulaenigrae TaxID=260714 RepID=UPI0021529F76|nr:peptide-methionine (S)-S-oxide reductase MsrA [Campylobacter insulaenigrae]MCR6576106.1 peptide-methionine (S)-S-oxide reductase MsrA [Campylobacter insulaenigrae]MCR6579177.1 peptide-methionine (S)-S-oxide reductase MsrA [Campylobacter insulaenigrae]